MVFVAGEPTALGSNSPRVTFGVAPTRPDSWSGPRFLFLDGNPAYELSFPCGTCQFLFTRLYQANDTVPVAELRDRLADGLDDLDAVVVESFGRLLERGTYVPLLLTVEPRLVAPSGPGDYFAEEQAATWGIDRFWGLPMYPRTAYYRTFETAVSRDEHLYEFVVPMVAPAAADRSRVEEYARRLASSPAPTAVAVAILDVCAPAVTPDDADYYEHWGLTHFLLDGHHKLLAAAETGRPLRLLSLLSVGASLAGEERVARVPALRQQCRGGRVAPRRA